MKQIIEKINKNAFWVFSVALLSLIVSLKDFIPLIIKHTMTIGQVLSHLDWGNFITVLIILTILYAQIKRNNRFEDRIKKLENYALGIDTNWRKEIANTIYPKLIRLTYRSECIIGDGTQSRWNYLEEKARVKNYFESDKHGLTVEECNNLMSQNFPELPDVV